MAGRPGGRDGDGWRELENEVGAGTFPRSRIRHVFALQAHRATHGSVDAGE